MVILLNPYGQRSNNLFQHIHIDSFCRDNGIIFYNRFIANMNIDYPNVARPSKFLNLINKLKIPELLNKLKVTTYLNFSDIEKNYEYKKIILKNPLVYCNGWFFRNNDGVEKYRHFYSQMFKPNLDERFFYESYLTKSYQSEKIIGLHIRRGDYKVHEDGRYYYNDNIYLEKIKQLLCLIDIPCKIIIFSNDDLNVQFYKDSLNNITFSKNEAIVDQFLMSRCDYLIGPPSTFSMWASYIGSVPLFRIFNPHDDVALEGFSVMTGALT